MTTVLWILAFVVSICAFFAADAIIPLAFVLALYCADRTPHQQREYALNVHAEQAVKQE